jgi:ribose-phosphate pyrophosphokinase
MVTHGLFNAGAATALADPAIDRLVVTDTVTPGRLGPGAARDKLAILPAAPLLAAAISRLHLARPLADLLAF